MRFNKKCLCAVISVLMAVLMIVLSFSVPVGALTQVAVNNESKIDAVLKEKIETMSDTDTVSVSVWFNDIDYTEVKDNVEKEINADTHAINISQKAIDLAFYDIENTAANNELSLAVLREAYSDVTTEEMREVIEVERTVVSEMYREHNQNIIDNVFADAYQTISTVRSSNVAENTQIDYVCHYAPNVDMTLTKGQILSFAEVDDVTEINYIDTTTDVLLSDVETYEDDEEEETYDTTFFNVTGLATARDAWGLDGQGMSVGIVESGGYPYSFDTDTTVETVYCSPSWLGKTAHAGLVASIMVEKSYKSDGTIKFQGAIPNAAVFAAAINSESRIKPAVEALLDRGVTAINCSFSYQKEAMIYNVYGDIAKWYDHISVQHNVHLILSSSNFGSLGLMPTNTSYNAIVVGACDNNGVILSDSSYITTSNFMNKPDLVAPGNNIKTSIYISSGTSFAAPMVTSAVVQLSQASSVLLSNPTLMKAVLMSSSTVTDAMSSDADVLSVENGTDSAISQAYGAGMLSVTKAYTAFIDNGYYKTATMSPYSQGVSYSKNLSRAVGKTIRVCLTWNKMNTVSEPHETGTVSLKTLDNFMLKVTTPSGVVYSSQNLYDNKQIISFVATESGTYTFDISRFGTGNSGEIVRYSLAYSVQS